MSMIFPGGPRTVGFSHISIDLMLVFSEFVKDCCKYKYVSERKLDRRTNEEQIEQFEYEKRR
jgi:hypothetical protein